MQSFLALSLLSLLLAATCTAEEAACAAADSDDDSCAMLQSGVQVGVVADHIKGEDQAKVTKVTDAKVTEVTKVTDAKIDQHHDASTAASDDSQGFPDMFKKLAETVKDALGLGDEFNLIKTAVATFATEVHTAVASLAGSVKTSMTMDQVTTLVNLMLKQCGDAALKLYNVLKKVTTDFIAGVTKIAPEKFTTSVKSTLTAITGKASGFADSFKDAAKNLKAQVNKALAPPVVCKEVKHHLDIIHGKVATLVSSSTGMTSAGLHKEITAAKDMLPAALKTKVDEVLKKADDAFSDIERRLTPQVKEIADAVAHAYAGKCENLGEKKGLPPVVIGIIAFVAVGMLAFGVYKFVA